MIVIVPNCLRDAINAKLDKAIEACPEAAKDREYFYDQLLAYFDEHGEVPDFNISKNPNKAPAVDDPDADMGRMEHDDKGDN